VAIQSGVYRLIFKATNKENNTSVYQKTQLSVSSIFGKGFYVNKYENGRTDVDFIDRYDVIHPNILKEINGEDLPGKPIRSAYVSNQYYYEVENSEGAKTRLLAQPAFLVCSDEDMRIYHGDNLSLLKKYEDAFLELPAVKKPQGVWGSTNGFLLINDNAAHFIYNNGYTVGQFGYAYASDGYKYSETVAVGQSSYMLFDEISGSFLGYHTTRNYALTSNFTNYDLIYIGAQPYQATESYHSYAIVKNRSNGAAYLIDFGTYFISYGQVAAYKDPDLIPADFDVANARVFTVKGGNGNSVIYYSKGDNTVHYYNFGNQTEKKSIITLPEGENIVYLEHAFDNYYGFNIFIVLANKNGKWMLHTYNLEGAGPDILLPETGNYSGNGNASNLIYRDPNTRLTY
jgi:hypothetical protein